MTKTIHISQEKARQILTDAREKLEERLALNVGASNYNEGPLNQALNAIDIQLGRLGRRQTYELSGSGYNLNMLLDKELRRHVNRVMKYVYGVSLLPSPDSLNYSAFQLALGLDDVATKWAIDLEQSKPRVVRTLEDNVIIHDLNGFSGNGFNELDLRHRLYLDEFHRLAIPLMRQMVQLEKEKLGHLKLGGGAVGGLLLGLGAGYLIDASDFYNFHTQLFLARFPVAMLESAGIAFEQIGDYAKKLVRKREDEPVIKNIQNRFDTFAKYNLGGPPVAAGIAEVGEFTGLNESPIFEGISNVENNNINNQVAIIAIWYNDYVKQYGIREGTRRFIKDPLVIANLAVTSAYLAYAVGGRLTGAIQTDTGLKSGGEAGFISCDTGFATALAMIYIYLNYITRHNQMLKSGIREEIYRRVV